MTAQEEIQAYFKIRTRTLQEAEKLTQVLQKLQPEDPTPSKIPNPSKRLSLPTLMIEFFKIQTEPISANIVINEFKGRYSKKSVTARLSEFHKAKILHLSATGRYHLIREGESSLTVDRIPKIKAGMNEYIKQCVINRGSALYPEIQAYVLSIKKYKPSSIQGAVNRLVHLNVLEVRQTPEGPLFSLSD